MTTPEQLTIELQRAYRCIQGMHNALTTGAPFAEAYHAPTIAAAKRSVFEGAMDGSDYFMGHGMVAHLLKEYARHRRMNTAPPAAPAVHTTAMALVNAGALQMVRNALQRDAEEGKQSRAEMLAELDKATTPVA